MEVSAMNYGDSIARDRMPKVSEKSTMSFKRTLHRETLPFSTTTGSKLVLCRLVNLKTILNIV